MSEKYKVFEKELLYIKDDKIREFTTKALQEIPDYFYEIAASSTGKYHSKFCLGEGGLVRHVQVATRVLLDLFNQEMFSKVYSELEKDIGISAILLHDCLKHSETYQKYSVVDHPILMAEFVLNNDNLNKIVDETTLHSISDCIRTHMGSYNKDYKTGKEVLPKPANKLQNMVHLVDYISSRKYFEEFNFDIEVKRI